MPPLGIDHVALPCFDPEATRGFYEDALGLRLLGASEGESPLWGGRRFLLMIFSAGGQALDLFAVEGMERPPCDALPAGARHVALALESPDDVEERARRLRSHGVWVSDLVGHGDHDSRYCFDPNGHQVELTFRRARRPASDPGAAREAIARFAATLAERAA
jgi:catechol 2,3-dioxygenase-like lactoylglutathione lyase family enzyme